jgi:beta-alanine degradation protein BauB
MRSIVSRFGSAAFLAAAFAGTAVAQESPDRNSVSIPADKIRFSPTGVKTNIGELMAGPAYGDFTKGAHATFIRMPAHFVSPIHSHTEDYFGIVVSGIGVNKQLGKEDISLPSGSYWFQRGGENHVTKCVSDTDCLFLIYQPGKFDYVLAK